MTATVASLNATSVQRKPRTGNPSKFSSLASASRVRTSEAGSLAMAVRQGSDMAMLDAFHSGRGGRCGTWSLLAVGRFFSTSPGEEDDRDPDQVDHTAPHPHHEPSELLIHLKIDAKNSLHGTVIAVDRSGRQGNECAHDSCRHAVEKEIEASYRRRFDSGPRWQHSHDGPQRKQRGEEK